MSVLYSLHECTYLYGDKCALREISATFTEGRFHGLLGPNGSGKTTLLDILLGILTPHSGNVALQNKKLGDYKTKDLAQRVSAVPQDVILSYDFTVEQVVMLGRHPHLTRFSMPSSKDKYLVEKNLKLLDVWNLRSRPANMLSGGEKQRVAVARALTQDTPILLLDEATSSLDIHHTIDIMNILRKKVKEENLTIIASIHDLNLAAAFCDDIFALQQGRLFASGNTEQVITNGFIQSLFDVSANVVIDTSTRQKKVEFDYFNASV